MGYLVEKKEYDLFPPSATSFNGQFSLEHIISPGLLSSQHSRACLFTVDGSLIS